MSGPAILKIEILSDAAKASTDLSGVDRSARDAAGGVDKLGASFDDASTKARQFGDSAQEVDEVGGAAGKTAAGLNDLSGAFELVGAGAFGEKMGLVSTVMEAGAGAADLYTVAMKAMTLENVKNVAATVARTTATVATTAAQWAVIAATSAWTAAQWLLNVAMSANPIGLIILAILILIGIIILIIKNWDTLKAVVLDVWASILGAIRTAWDWLKANVFDRLIAMVQLNVQIWRELWAAVKSTWDNIMNALANNAVTQAIQKVIDKVRELIDWFKSAKLPDWVTNLNPFANSAGSSRVFALAAGESAAGRGRVGAGSLLTETVSLAARLSAPAVVVNVILDGKRVGGYVDRVVTARLDDEGARLAAGAWG